MPPRLYPLPTRHDGTPLAAVPWSWEFSLMLHPCPPNFQPFCPRVFEEVSVLVVFLPAVQLGPGGEIFDPDLH